MDSPAGVVVAVAACRLVPYGDRVTDVLFARFGQQSVAEAGFHSGQSECSLAIAAAFPSTASNTASSNASSWATTSGESVSRISSGLA